MAFEFKKASCVVVGTFNIYVVQPPLLRQIGILTGDKFRCRFETNLTQPGFRFAADELNAVWTVRPDRIIVETADPRKDCGSDVAKVLEALPWTPVTAIGINGEYSATELDTPLWPQIEAWAQAAVSKTNDKVQQNTIHAAVIHDEQHFNLQAARNEHGFEISFNAHTELKRGNQLESNKLAHDIASNFFGLRREAENLIKRFFLVEISHEQDSNQGPVADNRSEHDSV